MKLLSGSSAMRISFTFVMLFVIGNAYADGGNFVDPHKLDIDTAQMRFVVSNSSDADFTSVSLYGVTANCWQCDPQYLLSIWNLEEKWSGYTNISTQWITHFRVFVTMDNNDTIEHEFDYHLYEHGSYTLEVTFINLDISVVWIVDEPAEAITTFIPLIVGAAVLVCLAILIQIVQYFVKSSHRDTAINHYEADESRQRTRVASLDVFRGGCLTIMIFVNYGGGGYWFFNHSYWNGLTVADLLFPWFIFIMGVAMPLSFQAMLKKGTSRTQLAVKMIKRTIILFSLGLFINNGADILSWRIPGVLQRFAISYLFTGFIILWIPTLGLGSGAKTEPDLRSSETEQLLASRTPRYKSSFLPFLAQWVCALSLLAIWFLVTFLLPVPGCPTGYMGPGGISEGGRFFNCTGGAAKYIDKHLFGLNHIYDSPTCQDVYHTGAYDPEGFLGCFTSNFLCFLGVQAGRIIQVHAKPKDRLLRWGGWGVFWGALGTLLCLASQNDGWIPINKNLWSPSFIFVMAGLGYLAFALCYLTVDVWRIWNGAPFLFVGMNSILLYCGHETLGTYFPFNFYTEATNSSHALQLASNMIGVGAWVVIAYKMYLNKFFVNI